MVSGATADERGRQYRGWKGQVDAGSGDFLRGRRDSPPECRTHLRSHPRPPLPWWLEIEWRSRAKRQMLHFLPVGYYLTCLRPGAALTCYRPLYLELLSPVPPTS
ncbi:hypothetical protein EYF80_046082 [Liparis tanakae]|uniref:Uncharacterized protein n=1 Tax=Liparis tanakae TaxID=230148 RepID=A0A4Z2FR63_9TELE|nr:hypothetical protein EYF80_046082 [Liparis tanakae]